MDNKYFVCTEGIIWTVYPNGQSNSPFTLKVNEKDVWVLGAEGLVEEEFVLWNSLLELAANIHHLSVEEADVCLDTLRSDLAFQLQTPDDLDWSYFLETAAEALVLSDELDLNMRGNCG